MIKKILFLSILCASFLMSFNHSLPAYADDNDTEQKSIIHIHEGDLIKMPSKLPKKFLYDSGVTIDYPKSGVKGIYTTAYSAGGDKFNQLVQFIRDTDLNAMVLDIKDDHGNITANLATDNPLINQMTLEQFDIQKLMKVFEEEQIYPIARIVVFKDSVLAKKRPELSFKNPNGTVWENGAGESFVNPFLKEVWEYNTEVAIAAAKLGFKEIQFDYVRFPEGFELQDETLIYSQGDYENSEKDNVQRRVDAVTDFVHYAYQHLLLYDVEVAVDIFGYTAVVIEAPGIGQSFPKIAAEVDVISSMIYPSHWGPGNLDIVLPDLDPYGVVDHYMTYELSILEELGDDAPKTRPWLQDFTASYLPAGQYKTYGAAEVSAQVEALAKHGIHEFLLWDAANNYSTGATYTFE
ncbi:putative glycoside hydrolase [Allofustis seminis]|uniref:putative glycoside hydrolase n=1 Tax=Allofustis seminis TaxID=166939 RepID=UPI00038033C9|nr:putative glycoside hydrolase [Allofustis seminis]